MHEFPLAITWHGSTAAEFSRDAVASTSGKADIAVGVATGPGASEVRWNPEDLFGASLAHCHMLTFLALAKKVGLDVRGYDGAAKAILDTVDEVTRITEVRLTPTITVAAGTDVAKVIVMFEKAHKYCYIGNSITAAVIMQPTIVFAS